MLRDRLVCGIYDKRVQRRFLQEATLTYDALKMVLAAESAVKDSKRLQEQSPDADVRQHEPTIDDKSVHHGLVSVYFIYIKIPNIMGLFYVPATPNIMDLFYVLSTMGLSYVQQIHNIMGLFYVARPICYNGSFLCTAPPTLHKKDP